MDLSNFKKKLQLKYKIPGRKYFTNTVIPNMYTKVYKQLLKDIELTTYISISTDIWTTNNNNKSFISFISVHWLTGDFNKCHAALGCQHFPERRHASQNICSTYATCLFPCIVLKM